MKKQNKMIAAEFIIILEVSRLLLTYERVTCLIQEPLYCTFQYRTAYVVPHGFSLGVEHAYVLMVWLE